LRRAFVGLDGRAFGDRAGTFGGQEDDFKLSAVTDSKLLLLKRSLSAASARFDVQDFQAVVPDRFDPEDMGYLGILRGEPEIEFFFRQIHFWRGHGLRNRE